MADTTHSPRALPQLEAGRGDRLLSAPGLECRELVGKLPGVGLFDLAPTQDGGHACIFCGVCAKKCPVTCINVRRDSHAQARGTAQLLRRVDHRRRAALHRLRSLRRVLCRQRARADRDLRAPSSPVARDGEEGVEPRQRARPLQRLRGAQRRAPGARRGRRDITWSPAPPAASRCRRRATPSPRGRAATSTPTSRTPPPRSERRRDGLPRPAPARQAQRAGQVHRLRRRRRHLRHRPAGALRRHGARPRHALRLLRQRRLHEHRLPALERHPGRGVDEHQPGGRGPERASRSTARTSPRSWSRTASPTWPRPRRTTRAT